MKIFRRPEMIYGKKKHPKLFWVEAIIYAAIILVCMLGSFGVFDAKGAEPIPGELMGAPVVETEIKPPKAIEDASCEKWIEVPSSLRIRILQYSMVTHLMAANAEEGGLESLVGCLSQLDNMKLLDADIVTECRMERGEEFLSDVFDRSLERIVFRCLKWVNADEGKFETDISPSMGGDKAIE